MDPSVLATGGRRASAGRHPPAKEASVKNSFFNLAAAAVVAAPLVAQTPDCGLGIGFPLPDTVEFSVTGPQQGFWGVVLVSLEAAPMRFPLVLENYVLVGFGYTDGKFVLTMPQSDVVAGLEVYAQGLALYGEGDLPDQLCVTEVKSFVAGANG
jgi:hypothetical protein